MSEKCFWTVFGGQNSPVLACFGRAIGGLGQTAKNNQTAVAQSQVRYALFSQTVA